MFFALGFNASGTGAIARFVLSVYPAARMTKAGGGVPVDNDLVEAVSDASGSGASAVQATGAQQPSAQAEASTGILTLTFAGNDNLQVPSPGDIYEILMVVGPSAAGDIFAIDTTATTDKPHLLVDIIESI